jgi:hypothetical protein
VFQQGGILSVNIPMRLKRHGGRKLIVTPDGKAVTPPSAPKQDDTLIKALVRAWKWQKLLDDGKFASIEALAVKENVNPSYVSRLLRLNFLAPDIKLAILQGSQPKTLNLKALMEPFPDEWEEQWRLIKKETPPRIES